MAKLKVYRMPIGFHDAYVAAPSQKAAAEAWGTDVSVFARKEAELVTDPKLMEEPLGRPGEVIKRLRGTADEQIAALGADEEQGGGQGGLTASNRSAKPPVGRPAPTPAAARAAHGASSLRGAARPKPKPRPSRAALDDAEREMEATEARHREERAALAEREAELERERKALEKKQREERERLEARREKAEAAFEEAIRRWRQ